MTTPAKRYARYRWVLYGKLGALTVAEKTLAGLREVTRGRPYSADIEPAVINAEDCFTALRGVINQHLKNLHTSKTWRQL
jgi:hypothetical protein